MDILEELQGTRPQKVMGPSSTVEFLILSLSKNLSLTP
jgi:hypothetical protein